MGSSQKRDQTGVPYTARQILNYWTTRGFHYSAVHPCNFCHYGEGNRHHLSPPFDLSFLTKPPGSEMHIPALGGGEGEGRTTSQSKIEARAVHIPQIISALCPGVVPFHRPYGTTQGLCSNPAVLDTVQSSRSPERITQRLKPGEG